VQTPQGGKTPDDEDTYEDPREQERARISGTNAATAMQRERQIVERKGERHQENVQVNFGNFDFENMNFGNFDFENRNFG